MTKFYFISLRKLNKNMRVLLQECILILVVMAWSSSIKYQEKCLNEHFKRWCKFHTHFKIQKNKQFNLDNRINCKMTPGMVTS